MSVEFSPSEVDDAYADPPDPGVMGYDNWPPSEYGTHPLRSQNGWRVPIETVDQPERDRRIMADTMELFLETCGKHPPLEEPETKRLLNRYQLQGDLAAKEKLTLHNLGLVVYFAKRIRRNLQLPPSSMAELCQSGTIGLIRAIEKADTHRQTKFSSYAGAWIQNVMYRYHGDTSRTIRLPVPIHEKLRKAGWAHAVLQEELGRKPTSTEVANALHWQPSELNNLWQATREPMSLDAFVGKDEDGAWLNRAAKTEDERQDTHEIAATTERAEKLKALLEDKIGYRPRRVLEMRYGLGSEHPRTSNEVGRTFNVTRERIRQIENQALKDLQPHSSEAFKEHFHGLSTEEQSIQYQEALGRGDFITMAGDAAIRARSWSETLHDRQQETAEAQARRLAEEAAAAKIDADLDAHMQQRALGQAYYAAGLLPTRQAFFEGSGHEPRYLAGPEAEPQALRRFRQIYGNFSGNVAISLHADLVRLAEQNPDETITLANLESRIEQYDDSLFGMRPEFMAAVLQACEQVGIIVVDRNEREAHYRLRKAGEPLNREQYFGLDINNLPLPSDVRMLHATLEHLGAGRTADTAITFAHLRRHWAENKEDAAEIKLRQSLLYLREAGLIELRPDFVRGHDIWLKEPAKVYHLPRLRRTDLWFDDKS